MSEHMTPPLGCQAADGSTWAKQWKRWLQHEMDSAQKVSLQLRCPPKSCTHVVIHSWGYRVSLDKAHENMLEGKYQGWPQDGPVGLCQPGASGGKRLNPSRKMAPNRKQTSKIKHFQESYRLTQQSKWKRKDAAPRLAVFFKQSSLGRGAISTSLPAKPLRGQHWCQHTTALLQLWSKKSWDPKEDSWHFRPSMKLAV